MLNVSVPTQHDLAESIVLNAGPKRMLTWVRDGTSLKDDTFMSLRKTCANVASLRVSHLRGASSVT